MRRRYGAAAGVLCCAGMAFGQVSVATSWGGPGVFGPLVTPSDATSGPSNGVCVVGHNSSTGIGATGIVRFDSAGVLLWERAYDTPAAQGFEESSSECIQRTLHNSEAPGFVAGIVGAHPTDLPECQIMNGAVLKILNNGDYSWGVRFPADRDHEYMGRKPPPLIQMRELADGSIFVVSTRRPRNPAVLCEWACDDSADMSTGVAVRLTKSGGTVFARDYSYGAKGDLSRVAFADVTIVGNYAYVIGTAVSAGACIGSDIMTCNAILVKMDFAGNVVGSWEFDNGIYSSTLTPDYASAITSIGSTVFFSFSPELLVNSGTTSTVCAFDTLSDTLFWGVDYDGYFIDYGSLKPGLGATLISGGQNSTPTGVFSRASEIDATNGMPNWFQGYMEPVTSSPDFTQIRGVKSGNLSFGYWLATWSNTTGRLYMMATDSGGNTDCESTPEMVMTYESNVVQMESDIRVNRTLTTQSWRPDVYEVKTKQEWPCDIQP